MTGLTFEQKIQELNTALNSAKEYVAEVSKDANARVADIERMIQSTYNEAFDADKDLQKALQDLESTRQLTSVEGDDWYHRWVRYYAPESFDLEALKAYLDERHVYYDPKANALTTAEGPCIIIDDEGDVYDQDAGKVIVDRKAYETASERNALIEAYMERTGCFPSVIKVDRYGEPFGYVNTQSKAESA